MVIESQAEDTVVRSDGMSELEGESMYEGTGTEGSKRRKRRRKKKKRPTQSEVVPEVDEEQDL